MSVNEAAVGNTSSSVECLSAEFREIRAGKDFFDTCRSPEDCCELTLQVKTQMIGEKKADLTSTGQTVIIFL